jgi:hypothetical protein
MRYTLSSCTPLPCTLSPCTTLPTAGLALASALPRRRSLRGRPCQGTAVRDLVALRASRSRAATPHLHPRTPEPRTSLARIALLLTRLNPPCAPLLILGRSPPLGSRSCARTPTPPAPRTPLPARCSHFCSPCACSCFSACSAPAFVPAPPLFWLPSAALRRAGSTSGLLRPSRAPQPRASARLRASACAPASASPPAPTRPVSRPSRTPALAPAARLRQRPAPLPAARLRACCAPAGAAWIRCARTIRLLPQLPRSSRPPEPQLRAPPRARPAPSTRRLC